MTSQTPWWMTNSFDFVKVPKDLFRGTSYVALSPLSKLLYAFLLDRANLSAANGEAWTDDSGNYFVYYTIAEIMERFGCAHEKASALLEELDKAKLITRTRKNRVKPYRIIVKPFVVSTRKQNSKGNNERIDEGEKIAPNKHDESKTDCSYTDSTTPSDRTSVTALIREKICYDVLLEQIPKQQLDGIVDVIVGTICTKAKEVRIFNDFLPREEVSHRLWELDQMDILYVKDALYREKNEIRYMRGYILARLLEAKTLSEAYYEHWARLDMDKKQDK